MLHRSSKGREGDPNPTFLCPIPSKSQLSSRDKKKMNTLRPPADQMQHPKDSGLLFRTMSKKTPHHTKPRPDNVRSRIRPNRTIKKIKKSKSIGKRHLRRPNRSNNSSPKGTNRQGGDIRCFSSMEASRKIFATNETQPNLKT